jgi:glyoxalase superfamily protein
MGLLIHWVTIDARAPRELARFWAAALDYRVLFESGPEDEGPVEVLLGAQSGQRNARLLFLEVHDDKTSKNRLHLDLRPDDQASEVARLKELGATEVDIGQGADVTWVVMADPEGNEFCVLRPRSTEPG